MTTLLRGVKVAVSALAVLIGAEAVAQQTPLPTAYLCPMHPDVVARTSGSCPRCGMALVLADPYDTREFVVDVTSTRLPSQAARARFGAARRSDDGAKAAGITTRLRLTVREPATRAVVRDFVDVHEKPYHLFVVSQDLEHYDHVHPQQRADGSHVVDVRLPTPGFYRLYSDFLPLGGTPQIIPGSIATTGFTGTLAAGRAHLIPDATPTRDVAGMRIALTLPADGLVAGRDETLRYHVVDAITGAAIGDLEPYLAAFGHTFILSEDTLHSVHAHPVELLPDTGAAAAGGPNLTFKALLPKPGRYRLWTQLKRHGTVSTVSFTVNALSPTGR